ncbi:MAG TPA: ABC transporter permease [Vicinamibacterales bacterium]|nr:ABC transporter permease [Vicinamibacterales bacterium]
MTRLYGWLLRFYPRAFRTRYGQELLEVFDQARAARPPGLIGTLGFCAEMLRDLLITATRQRVRQLATLAARPGDGAPRLPDQRKRTEMDTIVQDVRYALRQFTRRPGFTAIAVVSLALATGGNSLIYGMLDGFVFHPFPYPDPDRLVSIGVTFPKLSSEVTYVEALSPAEYADIRASRAFARTAAFDLGNRNISGGDVPERVFAALLLDDPFPVIGLAPALGRGFTRDELAPNGPPAAIISHRLWRTRFGGDPGILDRPIRIGGQSASVVGVMPPGLLLIGTDLWIPWGGDPVRFPRNVRQFTILARLAPGTSLEEANRELAVIAGATETAEKGSFAEYERWRLTATPWAAALLRDVRPAAFMLLVAVGLVLLIACANLTNLFLARSTVRQRELAVRLALGAGRGRLARLLLTESLLLALGGGVLGLGVAYLGLQGADALVPAQLRMLDLEAGLSWRVLGWTLALTLASGLLVGTVPALHATRTDPHESLKADSRSGSSRGRRRTLHGLVVVEIALSVVLLLGAGLLVRSVLHAQRTDLGFEPRGVLTMRLTLPRERYPGEAVNTFFEALVERLASLPGVHGVSAASQFPPLAPFETQFRLERARADGSTLPNALVTVATPRHFETLRVPLYAGRRFETTDRLDSPPVAIVNRAFASRYFPDEDAVGQRVAIGSPDRPRPWTTIVGVVHDYRNGGAAQPVRPELFVPMRQQTSWNQLFFLVRADAAERLTPAVRQAVVSLDPEQPIYAIQTLEEAVAQSVFQQRISAILLGAFAGVALVLAAIGIYGVMAYSVSARTQEIGVRVAVGARRGDIVWLVLRQVLVLSALGLSVGVALVVALGRGLEGLLVGVQPGDPLTIAAAVGTLGAVALLAAWIPAARAGRIDPMEALRYE